MFKKIFIVAVMLILFVWSLSLLKRTKTETNVASETEDATVAQVEEALPETVYSFNAQELTADCSEDVSEMLCAVENAVKCTLKPDMEFCAKQNLPTFIFMTDPTVERPTEINYRFINKTVLPNGTTEIYTESSCNGGWFGLCQGTIIYQLGQSGGKWVVRDIYGIE